jgi:uncharacterized protein (DUF1697 family)
MGLVVFLRGANVGGHHTFRPSLLAKELATFGVVNVGAAGTFVALRCDDADSLADAIRRRLPFAAEAMIRPSEEVVRLARGEPFGAHAPEPSVERYVSVLAQRPRTVPRLPMAEPPGSDWQVRVVRVVGCYALSVQRRGFDRIVYPNEVVERRFVARATTRNWNTIEKVVRTLATD